MFYIGHGYDAHRFIRGRKLVLGGVAIEFEKGLEGHSDADVLLHAICDACLGAAGLGDMGSHFPPGAAPYRNIGSHILLQRVHEKLSDQGYALVNVDATIIAQAPRLAPFVSDMRNNIAAAVAIDWRHVNVKATTTEGMGYIGREEGIAAHAVVLLHHGS